MIIPYNAQLDLIGNNHKIDQIKCVVGDTNAYQLNINVVKNNIAADLTNHTAKITFLKPDNTTVFSDLVIDDAPTGRVHVIFDSQVIAVSGTVKAEIQIYDTTAGRLTSGSFAFMVKTGLLNEGTVQSSNEFSALTTALSTLVSYDSRISTNASNISSLQTQVANMGDGSAKGVYATVTDLNTAFPFGNAGIYVVTADGTWRYWNGTIWASGGIYQATAISPLSVTPDKMDTNLKQYPFQVDATVPLEIIHAIKDIKLYNADPTKQYVMAVLQRNVSNLWCIRIYEWIGSTFGAKVCELNQTGYTESNLVTLTTTANGIYGYAIIDWSKLSANANYTSQGYSTLGLHRSTYINTFDGIGYAALNGLNVARYPFQPAATLISGGVITSSIQPIAKAIKKIELYGATSTKQYALTIIRRNWSYNSTYNWQLSIYEVNGQTFVNKVAEFLATGTYSEPSGVDVVSLSAVNSSGITAKVWTDWSQIPSGAGYDTMAYNETGLSRLTYQTVSPTSVTNEIRGIDNNTITPTFNANGQLTNVAETNGATTISNSVITYNSDGSINTVAETVNGKTANYTLNCDSTGNVISVTKTLS